jgi:predicted ATPase/tRNA A-37 threonylcarbamoyl transferase component Bud32
MGITQGTRLGRYEVRSPLGAGGMGEVYLAQDTQLDRTIALKVLPAELAHDRQRMRRFVQEAKAASALNHPNILTIHEIGQEESTHYIATEFIDGVTLRQRMKSGPMKIGEVLDIATQVASPLAAAHAAGIVHRDIKPENIMVRPDGYVKVLDFGLAKLTERQLTAVDAEAQTKTLIKTLAGVVLGTAVYMSPEQARGLEVDERTDIWSLGVVLYEMVAGRLPFDGPTTSDVIAVILHHEPPSLLRYRSDVPAELERIMEKALTKEREERYQTAKDLLIDLKRLKQRLEFDAEMERTLTPEESRERIEASLQKSHQGAPNNLSRQMTPLIGREVELGEVKKLLRQPEVRLVTLTGVGGTGKTRLAQQVAQDLLEEFSDGIFFIDLSATADPELIASSIAQPLTVKEAGSRPLSESLKDFLSDRQMLLVLDNFEQLLAGAPLVKELLTAAAALKVLVTSRAPLRLNGEHEFPVPPLALPETKRLPPALDLTSYAAVALFVGRAAAVSPVFALTGENALAVAEICTRLDGLPLAIELAAARVKLLSPQMILARLENRLKLLTGGARNLPARQQTMRGAISWSYDLLDESEKKLLNRLAVFAGGCTLEAAESVCGAGGDLDVEVLDGIASLIDKSLVVQKEQADGESRFRMLEVVREYALEALQASGEEDALRRLHAGYFLALAEEAEPELWGAKTTEWLAKLEEEHDNLRAALQWSSESDAETAVRLVGAIRQFLSVHGHLTEGRRWMEAALERSDARTPRRWKALLGAGLMAWRQGDFRSARKFHEEGVAAVRVTKDKRQIGLAIRDLGAVAFLQGDLTAARAFLEESLAIGRELGDERMIGSSLNALGELARADGDYAAARPLYEEAQTFQSQAGNKEGMGITHMNLGAVAYWECDLRAAHLHFMKGLAMAQELEHRASISLCLDGLAAVAMKRGDLERAARLAGAAAALRESIGYKQETADRLFCDTYIAELRAALFEEAFTAAYEEGRALRTDDAIVLALADIAT